MTTGVHQQPHTSPDDPLVADPNRPRLPQELSHWLNLPPAELELHAASFMQALEATVIPAEERASVAGALLDLLESDRFGSSTLEGRSLRGAAVETVLRIGYPWALQLDPDDLTAAREELRRLRPLVRWRRIALGVGVIATLAAAAAGVMMGFAPTVQTSPAPVPLEAPSSKVTTPALTSPLIAPLPANETAVRVAALRAGGSQGLALAVGEACVVGYEQPRPCLQEVARLSMDLASRSNDSFDLYRAKQWSHLIEEQSAARVREQARNLFENEFARDASFLGPSSVHTSRELMRFVEKASRLEAQGLARPLEALTTDCASKGGQFGLICRHFRDHAWRMISATQPFEVRRVGPGGAADQEADLVRRIITLRREDRIDDAITEATVCATTNSRLSADCSAVLADLYAQRYRAMGLEADRLKAERWSPTPPAP